MRIRMTVTGQDKLTRDLVRMIRDKDAYVKAWANSVAMEARENARKKAGRKWWRELARSVRVRSVGPEEADVGTDYPGAALKQFGGEVRPKNARALTIPIAKEAKGRRAYEFERAGRELFVVASRSGDPRTVGVLGYSAKKQFRPLYVLRTRAVMKPDPWVPAAGRISVLARREAERRHAKELARWNR